MIRFEQASVVVDDFTSGQAAAKTLLDTFDLTLAEHRVVAIGANGSGKSTLLKLINGLILPTTGTVTSAGFNTATQGREVRRRVGYIFTDPLAQLVMSTPFDDIELSLRTLGMGRPERRDRAHQILAERGLGHVARQSIYDLSGGERQLVSLATVLAIEPSIIVADEPTTLLDLRNRYRLRDAFAELDQQLIVSTHDLELAADADRCLLVDSGRIVADGAPAEVIAHYRSTMLP